jgi:hypothetical protein
MSGGNHPPPKGSAFTPRLAGPRVRGLSQDIRPGRHRIERCTSWPATNRPLLMCAPPASAPPAQLLAFGPICAHNTLSATQQPLLPLPKLSGARGSHVPAAGRVWATRSTAWAMVATVALRPSCSHSGQDVARHRASADIRMPALPGRHRARAAAHSRGSFRSGSVRILGGAASDGRFDVQERCQLSADASDSVLRVCRPGHSALQKGAQSATRYALCVIDCGAAAHNSVAVRAAKHEIAYAP